MLIRMVGTKSVHEKTKELKNNPVEVTLYHWL